MAKADDRQSGRWEVAVRGQRFDPPCGLSRGLRRNRLESAFHTVRDAGERADIATLDGGLDGVELRRAVVQKDPYGPGQHRSIFLCIAQRCLEVEDQAGGLRWVMGLDLRHP